MESINEPKDVIALKNKAKKMGTAGLIIGILSFFLLLGSLGFGFLLVFGIMFGAPGEAVHRFYVLMRNIFAFGTLVSGTAIFFGYKGLKGDKTVSVIGIVLSALISAVNVALVVYFVLMSI